MISNASQIYYYIYEPSQGLTFMVMYIYIYIYHFKSVLYVVCNLKP